MGNAASRRGGGGKRRGNNTNNKKKKNALDDFFFGDNDDVANEWKKMSNVELDNIFRIPKRNNNNNNNKKRTGVRYEEELICSGNGKNLKCVRRKITSKKF